MSQAMLGRIAAVTITTPDPAASIAAYRRYLDYAVVDDGALPRELARAWGRPQLAGRRTALLEPASGLDTYLRFVEGPAYPDYRPFACLGWNAAELIVRDTDALASQLESSPFRIIGPPEDLSFSDKIRAMQVVGPAGEVLYLTEIKEKLPIFDTPVALCEADRVFIVVLGGSTLDSVQDYYHAQLGVPRAPVMPSVISVLSAQYGLPREFLHPIAALPLPGQCYIEADEMPAGAQPRPCEPGELPPGVAIVSFDVEHLPADGAIGGIATCATPPYEGHRAQLRVGAAGELIELIERPRARTP
jgi:catechol 2,3-dioxygenase-like lactoylglutathione lyase family enzyme